MVIQAAPTILPISVLDLKKQLEIAPGDPTHNDHLEMIINSAVDELERDTGICLAQTVYDWTIDCFYSEEIRLPVRPASAITWIKYYDSAESQQTLDSSIYDFIPDRQGANPGFPTIQLKWDEKWPATHGRYDSVSIRFTAGYGDESTEIPAVFRQALLLLCTSRFEHRGETMMANSKHQVAYDALIMKYLRPTYL